MGGLITISTAGALMTLLKNGLDGGGALLLIVVFGWVGYLIVKAVLGTVLKLANSDTKEKSK